MKGSVRGHLLVAIAAICFAHSMATAQPPEHEAPLEEEAVPDTPPPPDPMEERLARLEARDQAREEALAAAQARVDDLERQLTEARAAEEAEDAEEAAAEAAEEAPSGPTIRPLASLFTRFEHRGGYAALGAPNPGCWGGPTDGDCLRYRAEAGLAIGDLRVADEVVAGVRFRPQVAGYWSFGAPATSGGVLHPSLALYEGNLILRLGEAVTIDAGRIVLNYGDQMVIGSLRWHPAGRSFDGARMRIQPDADGYWIDLFWTMLDEGGPGGLGQGDAYFYGGYAGLGPLLGGGAVLDVYALARQRNDSVDATTGVQTEWSLLAHVGGRFRHRVDVVDFRLEGGLQLGRAGQVAGTDPAAILAGHVDGEVGVNLLDDMVRLGAHGFFASGDDPGTAELEAYDQLYPTAHAFLGWSDVMGARTNVAGGALHVLGKPIPQLQLSLDVFFFARPEVMTGVDAFTGGEGDVQVLWLPGAGFRVRGMYALFVPNQGFWTTSDEPVHYVEVEIGYELN